MSPLNHRPLPSPSPYPYPFPNLALDARLGAPREEHLVQGHAQAQDDHKEGQEDSNHHHALGGLALNLPSTQAEGR